MKNILFLLLIFFIKLNAYEYLLGERLINQNPKIIFFVDENGIPKQKHVDINGSYSLTDINNYLYFYLYQIRTNQITNNFKYVEKDVFDNYYKNDLLFLNNLYKYSINQFLNYLYNENSFGTNEYINYENYELLYNLDGLVVESIVDGVWSGLYSDSERGSSGKLYNSSGILVYINAEPVNMFQQWLDPLVRSVVGCLMTAVNLIASPIGVVVSVVFVMAILYFVVWLGRRSLGVKDGF